MIDCKVKPVEALRVLLTVLFALVFTGGGMSKAFAEEGAVDGQTLQALAAQVPEDAVSMDGHRYKAYDTGMSWDDAKSYCESLGGHLATITSEAEQEAVESAIESAARNSYWLGGHKAEGNYVWITGEDFSFTHWAPPEPDNYQNQESCLMMYRGVNPKSTSALGQWNDLKYDGTCLDETFFGLENMGLVCEWEPMESSSQSATPPQTRLAGGGRYDTMESIVQAGFAASTWAVVATGNTFPDALSASALAGLRRCPIVLTDSMYLSNQARSELIRLGVTNAYVLGGTSAISDAVMSEVLTMGISATRIAGPERVATSIAALSEAYAVGGVSDTVIVASGDSFADALSIGPWAWTTCSPIVLVRGGGLTDEAIEAIRQTGALHVVIVGGAAVVPAYVESQLAQIEGLSVERLAGNDRYETSATIADWSYAHGLSLNALALATGANFPDALAAASTCGTKGSALILVDEGYANAATKSIITYRDMISTLFVLGGSNAMSDALVETVTSNGHV